MSDEQKNHPKLSSFQILLRASLVFVSFSVLLGVFFVFVIKLAPKKDAVLNIPRGGVIDIDMPIINEDEKLVVEICRGVFDSQRSVLAENVFGDVKGVIIPANYPTGNATIKIYVANASSGNIPSTPTIEKKIIIIASNTSGDNSAGESDGGDESGAGSSVDNSDSTESIMTLINSGTPIPTLVPLSVLTPVSTPIPAPTSSPSSGGTIIRATPTPTPIIYNTKHPVLINH